MLKKSVPYKWELVGLLWLAFFFNQADRQIYNVVLSAIRDDLGLSDADMGLVSSSLILIYGLLVPVAGVIGDRYPKKRVIIVSLLVWTCATLSTGMSQTLLQLILLRSVATGGGEAFYSPSANSLIGESHKKTLATALSIHQTALYVGVIASSYVTGYIADLYGWRMAFYVFGGAGIFLAAIILWRVRNTTPVESTADVIPSQKSIKEVLSIFFKKPTAILLALAFAGMQFAGVGFMTWMPTFLHEKYHLSFAQAGFDSTFYYKVTALLGIIIGARVADRFTRKITGMRGIVQLCGLALGVPALYFMGISDSLSTVYVTLVVFGLCQGLYDSNIFASLYDVIEPPYRSTATGIMLSFAFIVGAISPYVLGLLKPVFGLSNGIAFLSMGYLFAAFCIAAALFFFYRKDVVTVTDAA
jgi:MFS family permease